MSLTPWLVGALLVLVFALVLSYNRFVSQKNLIGNSWSNIDTELRRRYDLIPNLVEAVKGYASHERELFEEITAARARAIAATGPPETQESAEVPLVHSLRTLMAVAERYPELQSSAHFLDLQQQLVLTEDRIQAARRFYNANVRDYNERVRSIPSNVIARLFGFETAPYFTIDPAVDQQVRSTPNGQLDGA